MNKTQHIRVVQTTSRSLQVRNQYMAVMQYSDRFAYSMNKYDNFLKWHKEQYEMKLAQFSEQYREACKNVNNPEKHSPYETEELVIVDTNALKLHLQRQNED